MIFVAKGGDLPLDVIEKEITSGNFTRLPQLAENR